MRPLQTFERWVRKRLIRRLAPPPGDPSQHSLSPIRSILLLRIDRLGDATISTSIIAAIARRFPDATIDIVLSEKNVAIASAIPHVRRHHLWTKNPFRLLATCLALRAHRYDLCVNLHVKPSSNALLAGRVAGAAHYIEARPVDRSVGADLHIVEKTSRIVASLGVERIDRSKERMHPLRLLIDESDMKADHAGGFARADHQRLPVEPIAGVPLLINVSVFDPARRWPVEKVERLSMMLRDVGMPHAFIGSPGDRERLISLKERTGAPFVEPSDDILRLLSTLRRAQLVVSPDTFIVHAAAAFGVPVVGLYGSIEAMTEWRPWGVPHETLLGETAVADIEVKDVFDAIARLRIGSVDRYEDGTVERRTA